MDTIELKLAMKICRTIEEIRTSLVDARRREQRIALVPTMGALHDGHLSLVRAAKAQADAVVVSIFVNPAQFGPNEDFTKYPRTFEHDCELLAKEGADFIFAPSPEEMYPAGAVTYVEVKGISEKLDGRSRPGHFRGVTTVVSKLFHIIEPDLAFFGQKDAAQVAVIRRMGRDLNFPVEIAVFPIIREPDGLAMSSRNVYLSPQERQQALVLSRTLSAMSQAFRAGERRASQLIDAGRHVLSAEPSVRLDYLEVVDPDSLDPVTTINETALVAVAAHVGSTRLIDNVVLSAV